MKKFESPQLEKIEITESDVILSSGDCETPVTTGGKCNNMQVSCDEMCINEFFDN